MAHQLQLATVKDSTLDGKQKDQIKLVLQIQ